MYCFSPAENIYTYTIALRMAKKFEFLPQIDDIVRRLIEAGLFHKWQRDSNMYRIDELQKDDPNIILTVVHIGGAVVSLLCGLSLAIMVLMVECVAYRKTTHNECCEYWFLVSKFVDGRRFYFRSKSINLEVDENVNENEHNSRF